MKKLGRIIYHIMTIIAILWLGSLIMELTLTAQIAWGIITPNYADNNAWDLTAWTITAYMMVFYIPLWVLITLHIKLLIPAYYDFLEWRAEVKEEKKECARNEIRRAVKEALKTERKFVIISFKAE